MFKNPESANGVKVLNSLSWILGRVASFPKLVEFCFLLQEILFFLQLILLDFRCVFLEFCGDCVLVHMNKLAVFRVSSEFGVIMDVFLEVELLVEEVSTPNFLICNQLFSPKDASGLKRPCEFELF